LRGDPDRLARFTRKAQTLAALNHPNIAHIYGLEEAAAVRALVIELVEGEDLAQRLVRWKRIILQKVSCRDLMTPWPLSDVPKLPW
jgi:serine/threonine protein kinase